LLTRFGVATKRRRRGLKLVNPSIIESDFWDLDYMGGLVGGNFINWHVPIEGDLGRQVWGPTTQKCRDNKAVGIVVASTTGNRAKKNCCLSTMRRGNRATKGTMSSESAGSTSNASGGVGDMEWTEGEEENMNDK